VFDKIYALADQVEKGSTTEPRGRLAHHLGDLTNDSLSRQVGTPTEFGDHIDQG
jgi:hypothetical protein